MIRIPKEHQDLLIKSVVCIGEGEKYSDNTNTKLKTSFIVGVREKKPKSKVSAFEMIPKTHKGQKTDVIEIGRVVAQQTNLKISVRPLVGGFSVGHKDVTAGTIGIINGREIISNCHILANCNDCQIGDEIFQPGKADGNGDIVARLSRYVPIIFCGEAENSQGCKQSSLILNGLNAIAKMLSSSIRFTASRMSEGNEVDIAWATVKEDISCREKEIIDIGVLCKGIGDPEIGMEIIKTGRTTGRTTGKIRLLNATVKVEYGNKEAIFVKQFMTTGMSAGGDSGSIGVDITKRIIGLLFAGSEQVTFYNYASKIF